MTTSATTPEQPYTYRYKPGDEITITTDHGPRAGRVTAYGLEPRTFAVQLFLPEHEITPAVAALPPRIRLQRATGADYRREHPDAVNVTRPGSPRAHRRYGNPFEVAAALAEDPTLTDTQARRVCVEQFARWLDGDPQFAHIESERRAWILDHLPDLPATHLPAGAPSRSPASRTGATPPSSSAEPTSRPTCAETTPKPSPRTPPPHHHNAAGPPATDPPDAAGPRS